MHTLTCRMLIRISTLALTVMNLHVTNSTMTLYILLANGYIRLDKLAAHLLQTCRQHVFDEKSSFAGRKQLYY